MTGVSPPAAFDPTGTDIPLAQKGAASGVATLDGSGRLPAAQLPTTAVAVSAPTANEGLLWNGAGWVSAGTQAPLDNSVKPATTAYADAAVAVETARGQAAEALLAPLASPALTGNPTVPTQAASTNNTRAASTAYADAATLVEKNRALAAEALLAPTASPTFTGTTTAPEFSASGLTGAVAGARFVGATTGGYPLSGTFAVGDLIVDQGGGVWVCTVAGSPGSGILISGPAELGQVQISAALTALASTTDAAVTGLTKAVTVPGTGRPVYCDFKAYCTSATNQAAVQFKLYEDGAAVETLTGFTTLSATAGTGYQCSAFCRRTPAAGAHTYAIYYTISTGNFSVRADLIPASLRIWQA